MNFWKSVFASLLGSILFVGVLVIFIAFFVGIIVSAGDSEQVSNIKSKSILHLKFDTPIIERGNDQAFQIDLATFEPVVSLGLNNILADISKAQQDDKIEGIFLDITSIIASPSSVQDLRRALVEFKESGKWIVAYSEGYSQGGYYLASAADEVYLYPEGGLDFTGLSTELMFFKNMLDDLEVDVQIVRGPDNKYKSAVEPFMYEKMSDPNREQLEVLLNGVWNKMLADMASSRDLTVESMGMTADSLSIRIAEDALELGFVDGLKYRDEVVDLLSAKIEMEEEKELSSGDPKKLRLVSLEKYHKTAPLKLGNSSWDSDEVAVIYAVGEITGGEGDDETIGSERISKALRDARLNESVKAVVLRVNSPGGSALASDVIWRETQLIKAAGKPFVVSMGDLAASGGYYIAASADKIYANENTITGSIGVFGMIPNAEKMFNNKLGITFDRVQTNAHSGIMSITKPLDPEALEAINESVEDIYNDFTLLVAEGRGMSQMDVDQIAQGRVWTGTDAKRVGLVDEFGNLQDAIAEAANMAGMENYNTLELPKFKDPFEELMKGLAGEVETARIVEELGMPSNYVEQLEDVRMLITEGDRIQARMPFYLNWSN